jgi:hypothetical protein
MMPTLASSSAARPVRATRPTGQNRKRDEHKGREDRTGIIVLPAAVQAQYRVLSEFEVTSREPSRFSVSQCCNRSGCNDRQSGTLKRSHFPESEDASQDMQKAARKLQSSDRAIVEDHHATPFNH